MINERLYKYVSVGGAFLMWACWTFYINPGSVQSRLFSALCQGVISATATSLMISSIKVLSKHFNNYLAPAFIVTSITAFFGIFIHFLIGTPKIFATLAPAVSLALIFSLITSYNLSKKTARESV